MNDKMDSGHDLLRYQTRKLQGMMAETMEGRNGKTTMPLRELGLPLAEMECLRLFDGERYLTAKSVARKMGVTKSRETRFLSGLIGKGQAERIDDPKDPRIKLVGLTASGGEKRRYIGLLLERTYRDPLPRPDPEGRRRVISAVEPPRASMEAVKWDSPPGHQAG